MDALHRIAAHALARRSTATLAALLLSGAVLAAPDDKVLAAANGQQAALIETVKSLVLIETGSADVEGLRKLATVLEGRLQALGFKTERRKVTSGPGADVLIGTLSGSGRRKLMLQAHMDTVYQSGVLATQPIKQDGNRLYGPGIADDKGGIAVALHAIKMLNDMGWRDYATLTVLFNPDEEIGSIGSGEMIAQLADQHDVVLSCEPTTAKDVAQVESVLTGAAGTAQATLEVKGRSAHAGAAPQLGRNAAIELAHQMLQTRDIAKDIPGAQLNWTTMQAGRVRNQIPELAVAGGDVRLTQPGAETKLLDALKAKVASSKLVPDTETTVKLDVGRPVYLGGAKAQALALRAQAIYGELDRKLAITPMTGGATDAAFAARSGKAAVLESLGLPGWGYHARDEYIEIDSIVPRLYLMARMLIESAKE
jgi:glutamate carboxypeptidase